MRPLIFMTLIISVNLWLQAQPKKVVETVEWDGQEELHLEFDFANNITFELWDQPKISVEVNVEINNGEHNDIFALTASKSASVVSVEMDEDMWDKIEEDEWRCNWQSRIDYKVYLPKGLEVIANTISGDFEYEYFGTPMILRTISGIIDVTVPDGAGLDFEAKTLTGELYSDLEISFPFGKDGLRQIVGQDIKGRILDGGVESEFETISGNIYLRKG